MTRNAEYHTEITHPGSYYRANLTIRPHDSQTSLKFYSRSLSTEQEAADWITEMDRLLAYGYLEVIQGHQL